MSNPVEAFSESKVAILYQAQPPPVKDRIIKSMKAGGDADIAYALLQRKIYAVTSVFSPDLKQLYSPTFR